MNETFCIFLIVFSVFGVLISAILRACTDYEDEFWMDKYSRKQKIVWNLLAGPLYWIGRIVVGGISVFWKSLEDKPTVIGYSVEGKEPIYSTRLVAEGLIPFHAETRNVFQHFEDGQIKKISCTTSWPKRVTDH